MPNAKKHFRNLTPQQEAFADALATGMSATEAYKVAYPVAQKWKPASVWNKASHLSKHAMVVARLERVRLLSQRSAVYGVQEAMEEALQAFKLAAETSQPSAMVAAATLRAKLNGLLIERKETGQAGEFQALDAMRKADAVQAIQQELDRRARLANGADQVDDVVPK